MSGGSIPGFVPVLWAFLFCLHSLDAAPPAWRWSNPRPHGNHILEMAQYGPVTWQVCDRGQVYTMDDIYGWDAHAVGTADSFRSLTMFGNEVFISGARGTIAYGTSPTNLVLLNLQTEDWLEGITASSERLVAVGDNGAIYTSADGREWQRQEGFSTWLRGVARGPTHFVAVGEDGLIIRSEDGLAWNELTSPTPLHLNRVEFIQDRFWIVGDSGVVLTNDSQFTFSTILPGITNNLYAVAGNTREVLVAGDQAAWRYDLNSGSWFPESDATNLTLAPEWPYYSALWTGTHFLLGGRSGMLVEGARQDTLSPLVWTTRSQATRNWLWAVTRGPGFYAAVGDRGTIVTSDNGGEWEREVVPPSTLDKVLLGVGSNTNVMATVGTLGTIIHSPYIVTNVVHTNDFGEVLTNQVPLMGVIWFESPSPTTNDLQGIGASENLLVAAGAMGTIVTSPNGSNWVSAPSPVNTYLSSVASWPGGFVISGDYGVILTSTDGIAWQQQNSGVTNWIYNVRYLNDRLVAVGETGLILTSTNAVDWQRQTANTELWLNDVTYVLGQYYISANAGYLFRSPDTVFWRGITLATPRSIYGIAAGDGQAVAVGLEGVILRRQLAAVSGPVNFFEYDYTDGVNRFVFGGEPDQFFALQRTEKLDGSWQTVAELEIVKANGTLYFEWPSPEAESSFFRTTTLP